METGEKNWAQEYLIDPLTAPQPSEESGPGTSLLLNGASYTVRPKSPPQRRPSTRLSKPNPRKSIDSTSASDPKRSSSISRPPPSYAASVNSATTTTKDFKDTKDTKDTRELIDISNARPDKGSNHSTTRTASTRSSKVYANPPPSAFPRISSTSTSTTTTTRPRKSTYPPSSGSSAHLSRCRTGSLSEKFPGDMSHRPLDTLRKEKYIADRARHATRKHQIPPDSIDSLDDVGICAYHHSGPYDPTLFARNNCANSPLAALADSNAEALKATPYEKIVDSVKGHRPLDGVAAYAPGETDPNGRTYTYEEGDNMMIADGPPGGAYKRWPGIEYHPDDIKGKGEPSYSIEKALKEMELQNKYKDQEGIEMTSNHHHHLSGHRHRRHSDQGRQRQSSQSDRSEQKPKGGGASGGPVITTTALDDEVSSPPQRSGSLKAFRRRIGSLQRKAQIEA